MKIEGGMCKMGWLKITLSYNSVISIIVKMDNDFWPTVYIAKHLG